MVDTFLPIEKQSRPLRSLFLDLNAYFASVEQQERPELRGRPVAVVPVYAETTGVIAASYEAKKFGVKCGTMIRDARQMCPGIVILQARPSLYVEYHRRVLAAVDTVLPVAKVCSIDEMRFDLIGGERAPANAETIALRLKEALRTKLGEHIKASVGIAPNSFLAKLATELRKPDGLVVLEASSLPTALLGLKLTDFTGINRRMAARLHANGIFNAEELCAASRSELRKAFGGVVGERWWYMLRGYELEETATGRKSLSHSHVLPPELRNRDGCREVLLRLIQKASARLRANHLWAAHMQVSVRGFDRSWQTKLSLPATQDTLLMNEAFMKEWKTSDFSKPRSVSVWFSDLRPKTAFTPSLFDDVEDHRPLMSAVDQMNHKFGKNSVFLAGMERAKGAADEKIAFQKTELFVEGKGDHLFAMDDSVDTFRGLRANS